MEKLFQQIRGKLSADKNYEYSNWLTINTPRRISGMGDDRKAAEWISKKFVEFGLESKVIDFETYNSNPIYSEVKVLEPETRLLDSLPCCHIASTPPDGLNLELLYLGAGDYRDYEGKDVKGKAVLIEVSYSPATPEKARIAAEKGARAMVCANWGEDSNKEQDYICGRGLKSVWGNPTPDTFGSIPQIAGVSVTHSGGLYLKDLCLSHKKVVLNIKAEATRTWDKLPMPVGYLRGSEEPDKYLLVNGHIDAWEPGVTCNATGNGTILTIAELLAKHRDQVKRSIYFICWNGHEIAESAGSTWYVDHHWDDLEKNCIGGINIDSTGMLHAVQYECTASREVMDFTKDLIKQVLQEDTNVQPLNKFGDQSFFGIGITSIVGRMGMSDEYIEKTHGANLGWWNHTIKDGMDKVDKENLKKDLAINAATICNYVNNAVLPYDFTITCQDVEKKLAYIIEKADKKIELQSILDNIKKLQKYVVKINEVRVTLSDRPITDEKVRLINALSLKLSRCLTWAFYTFCDRFEQNSYAYTPATRPIPLLYTAIDLSNMDPDSLEYKLKYTSVVRNRNRVSSAVCNALEYCELYLALIEE
ncbi:M28 family peptidase [Petroclostridium sp. X23]|uniref:M28 family peptidase n=1 Tax=Petroclostridium sp. X23 TaxID=3045146 RepID=UPI0024AE10EF|nr:M28 family peptidase [Petroclostridium sp. X23]WHH61254.1 M28 family peptidase [Petroclostridium sp. X23]